MPKPPLPQIYCNVHIKPGAIEAFTKQGLKCIRISDTSKDKDRDEKDFIGEIYAKGKLFATGHLEFTEYVRVELRPALEGCEVGDALCTHATPSRWGFTSTKQSELVFHALLSEAGAQQVELARA